MCGIAALIGNLPKAELEKFTATMISVISHRGPDGEGIISAENIALGHRRLAIVDLSEAGAQPMASHNRRYWITYNGEVYNFPELRTELESKGSIFRSHSDTEVILEAYVTWGAKCLEKFNGMFAFVIWDSVEKTVFIARDRFGIKPLYWWRTPSGLLAFASEIKQFTILPGWRAKINPQRAYDFLCWAITDHTDETMFDGVFHLPPGTYALVNLNNSTEELMPVRWYFLSAQSSSQSKPHQYANLLNDSVRLRLRADVKVGSCLSGGLDSTALVSIVHDELAKANSESQQMTFSAVFPGEPIDESEAITQTQRMLGIKNDRVTSSAQDFQSALQRLIWHQDEPFSSASVLAQWRVFELSKKNGVKVMLDGQGADEQLAGYHTFFGPYLNGVLINEGFRSYWRELSAIRRAHGFSRLNLVMKTFNHSLPPSLRDLLRRFLRRQDTNPKWLSVTNLKAEILDPWSTLKITIHSCRDFSRALLTSMNLQMLLRFEDRNSMAQSIEARVPFLDYRLVETAIDLPENEKIRNGQTKWVLRQMMIGKIPASICTSHKKLGFETPQEKWFSEIQPTSGDWPYDLLTDYGKELVTNYESRLSPITPLLFRLFIFEKWRQVFGVK